MQQTIETTDHLSYVPYTHKKAISTILIIIINSKNDDRTECVGFRCNKC